MVRALFNIPFYNGTFNEVLREIENFSNANTEKNPLLITPNVHHVVKIDSFKKKDLTFYDSLRKAYLILPDGQPIIWASSLLRKPLNVRLAGSDLFDLFIEEAVKKKKQKVFFIASNRESVEKTIAKANLHNNFDFFVPPYFDIKDTFVRTQIINEIVKKITQFKPRYVIVGVGFPKQEKISLEVIEILKNMHLNFIPLFLCIGAALEFYGKVKKRAPLWIQKIGLEWFYRVIKEPKRLWKRYLTTNTIFIWLTIKEFIQMRILKKSNNIIEK